MPRHPPYALISLISVRFVKYLYSTTLFPFGFFILTSSFQVNYKTFHFSQTFIAVCIFDTYTLLFTRLILSVSFLLFICSCQCAYHGLTDRLSFPFGRQPIHNIISENICQRFLYRFLNFFRQIFQRRYFARFCLTYGDYCMQSATNASTRFSYSGLRLK